MKQSTNQPRRRARCAVVFTVWPCRRASQHTAFTRAAVEETHSLRKSCPTAARRCAPPHFVCNPATV